MANHPPYKPIQGKTYSLFGNSLHTEGYYEFVKEQVDSLLKITGSQLDLLDLLRTESTKDTGFNKIFKSFRAGSDSKSKFSIPFESLRSYTEGVDKHLRGVNCLTNKKSAVRTTEKQYHLYMLEIELTNRINNERFKNSGYKIALLPHCLRDIWHNCEAEANDIDQQCRHCNEDCYLNHASKLLMEHNIGPYIWTTRNLKQFFKKIAERNSQFGVLGIACIPELIMGMRKSMKYGIPAVGIPLNANCCVRWFGEYRENSIDLEQLEKLLN